MNGAEKKPDQSDAARNPAKPGDEASQSNLPATTQTHLAWLRTRMSIETALAAWVRTATSLIGFGFAIVQFFEHLNEVGGSPVSIWRATLGWCSLALAPWQRASRYRNIERW